MPSWNPETTQKALRFASRAHHGQQVPGSDLPYIIHPVLVCMEVMAALQTAPELDGDLAVQCALLHDVIEDTTFSYQDLVDNFGERVAQGVLGLSKDDKLPHEQQLPDSLKRIRLQPKEIWMVKLADRIVNLSPPPGYWTIEKCQQYREDAILIHEALHDASTKLGKRLLEKIEEYKQYC